MSPDIPNMIQKLFERFGQCKIVRHEYEVPLDQFRIGTEVRRGVGHGVCVVVRTKKGEFVLIRHRCAPDLWALPCGNIEINESFEEAGVREALEETGLNIQIKGLCRIFQFVQKAPSGEAQVESYVVVFFGEVISGELSSESPETLEVEKFKKLPENFAGELRKYYEDLT